MTTPTITALNLYPVKGAAGQSVPTLTITPQLGIEGDRQSAYAKRPTQPEKWAASGFYSAFNTAALTNLPATQATPQTVQTRLNLPETPKLLSAHNRFNFAFNKGPTVSLLNLATVKLFETYLHQLGKLPLWESINADRFRMNVHIDGLPPFAELDYPEGTTLTLGPLQLQVREACVRCKGVHANPLTGKFDFAAVPLLTRFMEDYHPNYRPQAGTKKAVMGLILNPSTPGQLTVGDKLVT